jgi:signal peptidase I
MRADQPISARSRLRTLVQWCVFLWLAAALAQTWFIGGLVVPYRIAGGSMAGTLLGVHRDVVCGDCGCPFASGTDVCPAAVRAVCPNCGYAANDLESLPDVKADRVLIDRRAFSIRAPRRWEIAAFRRSPQADKILIKRIVGLPGESIEIRHGDVYVDGHIQRKNLAEQRALAVLVHDANYWPTREPTFPPRWQADRSDSRWSATGGRFSCAAGGQQQPVDWLVYHHWRRLADAGGTRPSPITDLCGYNQSQPRRDEDVHAVNDLMLSFRLAQPSGHGTFCVRLSDGRDSFEARLQCDASRPHCQIFRNGRLIPVAAGQIPAAAGQQWLVEASLVDQQFLLAIDGQQVVVCPYDRPEPPPSPVCCPLAIGAKGLEVMVRDLRVYRDTYYTHPIGPPGLRPGDQAVRLEAGHYYMLGDNSPVSEDSRTWPESRTIDAKLLVGKPLVAISSVPFSLGRRWPFQVPNLLGIRYIQ